MSSARPFLLDTGITGYIISGRSPQARRMLDATIQHSPVLISTVTQAEILYGLELKAGASRLRSAVDRLFEIIEVRPWDSAAAQAHSRLLSTLRVAGKTLANADLMIAAHALSLNAILVSHDQAFQNAAPNIPVVDWSIAV